MIRTARLVALFCLLAFVPACAESLDVARSSRNTIGDGVTEARIAWEKTDAERFAEIKASTQFREDAQKAVLAYANGEHAEAVKIFASAWAAVRALDKAIEATAAGLDGHLQEAIAQAWAAWGKVDEILKRYGVKLADDLMKRLSAKGVL